jgi:hypothetical protein
MFITAIIATWLSNRLRSILADAAPLAMRECRQDRGAGVHSGHDRMK